MRTQTVTISFPIPNWALLKRAIQVWIGNFRRGVVSGLAPLFLPHVKEINMPEVLALLQKSLEEAKKLPKVRETAITITKIEEAIMWFGQHQISYVGIPKTS